MNLLDLDKIIADYQNFSDISSTKIASEKEGMEEKKKRILNNLKTASVNNLSGDFYSQLNLMEKQASSVAREILGLDANKHGVPTIDEAFALVFGGKE